MAAGRGVDEFEQETHPAWPRLDSSGCSRVLGDDKIALAGAGMGEYAEGLGLERATKAKTARLLDKKEESQETDFEATLFVWPDKDIDLLATPCLWTDKEIDWFIDADLLWLVKQMVLELEATEWMAMDEEEVLQVSDFVANIEPPFEPDGEAWLVGLLRSNASPVFTS
ncbi:hypothetical protein B0H14DRAFT_3423103 [Mycena olivaceomarginata]|nr:hypothetical protein B0H14DRAFT_3423103 [Mycena olivaceomarginata]